MTEAGLPLLAALAGLPADALFGLSFSGSGLAADPLDERPPRRRYGPYPDPAPLGALGGLRSLDVCEGPWPAGGLDGVLPALGGLRSLAGHAPAVGGEEAWAQRAQTPTLGLAIPAFERLRALRLRLRLDTDFLRAPAALPGLESLDLSGCDALRADLGLLAGAPSISPTTARPVLARRGKRRTLGAGRANGAAPAGPLLIAPAATPLLLVDAARLPALADLELDGAEPDAADVLLAATPRGGPVFPALRRLSLRHARLSPGMLDCLRRALPRTTIETTEDPRTA